MSVPAVWTFQQYLKNRLDSGIAIERNEAFLMGDIERYLGGKIQRTDAQNLKIRLTSARGVKQLLETKKQKEFLHKIRKYERKQTYLEKLHVAKEKMKPTAQQSNEAEIAVKDSVLSNRNPVRKDVKNLSASGKRYRRKTLLKKLGEGEAALVIAKEKVNPFESINFQKVAHMSERDLEKTSKLFERKVGCKVFPGRHMRKKARQKTLPENIQFDDFKAEISLQNGLSKTAERLLNSNLIGTEQKMCLKTEKECILYSKSGQDGTTGFALNNKKTKRGQAKHQVAFVPLQLRKIDGKSVLWKNPKPNSNRNTKLLKSRWATETSNYIIDSHESLEKEIAELHPVKVLCDDEMISVSFVVLNVMNDGKEHRGAKSSRTYLLHLREGVKDLFTKFAPKQS